MTAWTDPELERTEPLRPGQLQRTRPLPAPVPPDPVAAGGARRGGSGAGRGAGRRRSRSPGRGGPGAPPGAPAWGRSAGTTTPGERAGCRAGGAAGEGAAPGAGHGGLPRRVGGGGGDPGGRGGRGLGRDPPAADEAVRLRRGRVRLRRRTPWPRRGSPSPTWGTCRRRPRATSRSASTGPSGTPRCTSSFWATPSACGARARPWRAWWGWPATPSRRSWSSSPPCVVLWRDGSRPACAGRRRSSPPSGRRCT